MAETKIVTLLTDFGTQDVYVGVMKAIIAQIAPQLIIIDLTHEIPPQNIAAGRFCLMDAYTYFPLRTVHIAVVDPGVGSQRRGIAVEFAGGFLVGPDNGLFSGILSLSPAISAVELTNTNYWRSPNPSMTFHGRDIFAPVGANLACGIPITELGKQIDPNSLIKFPIAEAQETKISITGYIQYIDRFGNLITNIPAKVVEGKNWSVVIKDTIIPNCKIYSDRSPGEILALIGSHGWIEIAVNGGSAKSKLQLDWGKPIEILLH